MSKILSGFNSLPGSLKGILGIAGIFIFAAGFLIVSAITDPPREILEYNIDNHIDQTLLPVFEEENKKPKKAVKPQRVVEVPRKDTFQPIIKKKPKKKKKPTQKMVQKPKPVKKVKSLPRPKPFVKVVPALKPKLSPIDPRIALRRDFNHRRLGFSKVSYTSAATESSKATDLNRQDTWPVPKDENTYPTDLSRVVTKEKFISAILNNRIESTFAGKILLTIDHNIYGSHGNKILIPIGTKASGTYKPVEKIGIDRLLMTIERMVTPDGQLILFQKPATVADQQGATGVKGDVNNKYLQKFGLPLAFSVANNTTNLLFQRLIDAVSDPQDEKSDLAKVFNEQWSKDQSQTNRDIISDIIKNNINIMPTISIEPGQKILLFLDHDIWFKPNKNGITEVAQAQPNINL